MILKQIANYVRRMNDELPLITDSTRSVLRMKLDFIWCFVRYGTVLDQYVRGGFYKLSHSERDKSVTYRRINRVYNTCITPGYVHFLSNKTDFNNKYSDLVRRQWLYAADMTFDEFSRLYTTTDRLIVKPIDASEGRGIFKLARYTPDADIRQIFDRLHGKNYIIEECLKSHRDTTFGASSLNTLRVHSIMDRHGDVHFIKFILRAGVGNTDVDNYCAGGCIYEIDEFSGRIISPGYSKKYPASDIHPGTDIIMPGRQIPYWNETKSLVIEAHRRIPRMRFIGWDVAITDKGPVLIEGNHHPDYDLLEFVGTRFWWHKIKQYL